MPLAVFTDPQIGGVGRTEAELDEAGVDDAVGTASFPGSIMGRAKKLEHGLAKALADAIFAHPSLSKITRSAFADVDAS